MGPPIEDKYHEQMNRLAGILDKYFNDNPEDKKIMFCVLVAEADNYGGGRVNYISNAKRDDMIAVMKEYIARVEGRYTDGESERKQ